MDISIYIFSLSLSLSLYVCLSMSSPPTSYFLKSDVKKTVQCVCKTTFLNCENLASHPITTQVSKRILFEFQQVMSYLNMFPKGAQIGIVSRLSLSSGASLLKWRPPRIAPVLVGQAGLTFVLQRVGLQSCIMKTFYLESAAFLYHIWPQVMLAHFR